MHYLILDTDNWIYLAEEFIEVREKLSKLVDEGKAIILLPEIVIEEWNRNKGKIVERREQSIRGKIKNARFISDYLEPGDAEVFKQFLDKFQKDRDRIIEAASEQVDAIESLFNHPSTIKISIADTVKLQAVKFALDKKAPFQEKNSMGDALIILGAVDYIEQNSLSSCIFVSNNKRDFSSKSDTTQIHEDLLEYFNDLDIKYFLNIGQAINEIQNDLISETRINEIEVIILSESTKEALKRFNQQLMDSSLHFENIVNSSGLRESLENLNTSIIESSGLKEVVDRFDQVILTSVKPALENLKTTVIIESPGLKEALERLNRVVADISVKPVLARLNSSIENLESSDDAPSRNEEGDDKETDKDTQKS